MTRRNAKKSLILAALMGCSVLSPVEAQEQAPLHVQGERGSGMSIPKVLLPRPPTPPAGSKGDDLGSHIATMNLSMGGNTITNMLTNVDDMGSSVNMQTLLSYIGGIKGDNLGDHKATMALDLAMHKAINMADSYNGDDYDGVNLRTLKRYISEIPGDNLGSHIASQQLIMNGKNIAMGDFLGYDTTGGLPIVGPGLTIGKDVIWGLSLPKNPSEAANKEYVDSRVDAIDLSGVVYTTGDQQIDGVKSFVRTIVAQQGLDANNSRIVSVADPTSSQDAVNLRSLQAAVGDVERYKSGTGITFGAKDAAGLIPIGVNNTVVRTTGNQTVGGVKTFSSRISANLGITTNDQRIEMVADPTAAQDAVNLRTLQAAIIGVSGGDNLGNHIALQNINASNFKVINLADPTAAQDAVNLRTLQAAVAAGGDNLGNHIAIRNIDVSNFRVVNVAAPVNGGDVTNKTYVDNLFGSVAQYSASDGITFGAPVSGVTPIMVNSTVVRTTGNQTVGGVKTFSSRIAANLGITTNNQRIEMVADPTAAQDAVNLRTLQAAVAAGGDNLGNHIATQNVNASNFKVINLADPTAAQDAVNLRTLQAAIAAVPDTNTTYTAGDGLTLAGTQFAVNGTVVRTTGNQTIGGVKTFTSPLVVTNTFNINGSAPSQQQNGLYVADLGTTVGTTLNPTLTAAVVAQINNTRSIGLTVDANGYLHGYRTHTNAGSYTWESQVRFADRLTTARTINGVAFDGSANITIPGDNLGNHTATRNLVMSGYDVTGVGTVSSTGTMWITAPTVRIGTEGAGAVGNFILQVDDSQQSAGTRWAVGVAGTSMSLTAANGWMVSGTGNAGFTVDGTWAAFGNVTRTGGTVNAWVESGQNTILKSDGYVNVIYKTYFDISKQTVVRDSNNQTISIDNDPAFRVQPGAIKIGLPMSMSGAGGENNYKITDLGDATNPMDAVNLRTLQNYHTGSSGITIGVAGAISVDATVVRTSGPQTIAGQKIFTTRVQGNGGFDAGGQTILRVATPVNGTDAANKAYVDSRTSDIRLKKNVEEMTGDQGLSIIRRLRPVTFDYKKDDKHFAGVIAQETREVMPYTVVEGEDGYLGVEYIQFIAPIISSVKALDNEVTSLKARVEGIETRLEALETR